MTMKRILAMLLSVLMVFSMLSIGVSAEEPEAAPVEENLTQEQNNAAEEQKPEEGGLQEENQGNELNAEPEKSTQEVEVNEELKTSTLVEVATGDEFANAIASYVNGTVIKLTADITLSSRLELAELTQDTAKSITINLNGHNISYTATKRGFILVRAFNSVSIIGIGNVNVGTSKNYFSVNSDGSLTVSGGNYIGTSVEGIVSGSGTVSLCGGTFGFDPSAYVATDYEAVKNTDTNTWTVQPKPYVAQVGTNSYRSFAAAAAAATAATDTIKLLANVGISEKVSVAAGTIDLNGYTITNTGAERALTITGTVTVTDNSTGTPGGIVDNSTMTSGNGSVFYVSAGGELTIEKGAYTKNSGAANMIYAANKSDPKAAGKVTINGGTFTGALGKATAATISITGGTFSVEPTYLATGYEAVYNETTKLWTVQEKTEPDPDVAEIGEAKYTTIEEAFKKAVDGSEIKLLADCTLASSITISSGTITLDLNGFAVSGNNKLRHFQLKGGSLVLKDTSASGAGRLCNGNATGGSGGAVWVNDANSTFTMQGGTISSCTAKTSGGAVMISSGTFEMTGGTITGCSKGTGDKTYGDGVRNQGTFTMTGGTIICDADKTPVSSSSSATISVTGGFFSSELQESYSPDDYVNIEVSNIDKAAAPWTVTNQKATITYDINGGVEDTLPEAKEVYYLPGCTVETKLTTAAPDGTGNYIFKNWNTDAGEAVSGTVYEGGAIIQVSGDITLFAIYREATTVVAMIGADSYVSLTKAIRAAGTDTSTVTLKANVTENVRVNEGQTLTINLGTFNITGAATGSAITNKGTLTLEGTGKIEGTAQSSGGGIDNSGTLTVKGVSVTGSITAENTDGGLGGGIYNSGTLVIESGSFSGTAKTGGALYNKGDMTIKGGTIEGTASNNGASIYSNKNLTISGGTVNESIYIGSYSTSIASVSGGEIKGEVTKGEKATLTITGGKFTSFNPEEYLASNCGVNDAAPYTVVFYVAEAGGTRYETFEAAKTAAFASEEDVVIKLLVDVTGDIELNETVSIDTNGKTLTGTVTAADGMILKADGTRQYAIYPRFYVEVEGTRSYFDTEKEAVAFANGIHYILAVDDETWFEYEICPGETVIVSAIHKYVYCSEGILVKTEVDDPNIGIYTCYPELVAKASGTAAAVDGDPVVITVYKDMGEGNLVPMDSEELDWNVLFGSNFITGENGIYYASMIGGTVTVKATLPGDPVGRGVSISFNTVGLPMSYKVINADYVDEKAVTEIKEAITGSPINYVLKPVTGEQIVKTTVVSSDKAIAAVKDLKNGTWQLTLSGDKKNAGACTVTFTPYVKQGTKTVAMDPYVIDVSLIDYTPGVAEKVTLNSYNSNYVDLPLTLREGNKIYGATLVGNDGKGNPVETAVLPVDVEYWPECGDVLSVWATETFKGTIKALVKFNTEQGTFYSPLAITAKNVMPKVTIKQLEKLAAYDYNSEAVFGITLSEYWVWPEDVKSVEAAGYDWTADDGEEYGYDVIVKLSRDPDAATLAKNALIEIALDDEYFGDVVLTAKSGIATIAKPSLSLVTAASTVNGLCEDPRFKLEFYDKNTKSLLNLNEADIILPDGYTISPLQEDPYCRIVEVGSANAGKYAVPVTITPEGWNQSVSLKYTLTVDNKVPTVKLSSSSLSLNSTVIGSIAETSYVVSQTNAQVETTVVPVSGSDNINIVTDPIDAVICAKITGTVPAGSYKYNVEFKLAGADAAFKTLPLTVKVVDKAPEITAKSVKAVGNDKANGLDVTKPESFAAFELTLSNLDKTNSLDQNSVCLVSDTNKEQAEDRFEIKLVEANGKTYLKVSPASGVVYDATSYSFLVKGSVNGTDIYSKKVTVKLAASKLQLIADSTTATLSQTTIKSGKTLEYTFKVNGDAGMAVGDVSIGNVNGIFRKNLADSCSDIRWEIRSYGQILKVYVTVDNTCRLARNKTYTLPLIITPAGNGTPAQLAKAAASFNLTIKVVK